MSLKAAPSRSMRYALAFLSEVLDSRVTFLSRSSRAWVLSVTVRLNVSCCYGLIKLLLILLSDALAPFTEGPLAVLLALWHPKLQCKRCFDPRIFCLCVVHHVGGRVLMTEAPTIRLGFAESQLGAHSLVQALLFEELVNVTLFEILAPNPSICRHRCDAVYRVPICVCAGCRICPVALI